MTGVQTCALPIYENLQWDTGLWGIIPFCIICGALTQYMYWRAFSRYAALLTYAFMAWALFSAPLYNHFLNLVFLPLPAVVFFVASTAFREIRTSLIGAAAGVSRRANMNEGIR